MSAQLPVSFRFEVVKPDGVVLSATTQECIIPGALGYFGVLPGHTPFLTLVGTGEVTWRAETGKRYLAVSGGFCEVRPDQVTILAEIAEKAEEIDAAKAARERDEATAELSRILHTAPGEEIALVREKLDRAEVRVAVAAKRSAS